MIGETIKRLRAVRRWKQGDLARRAGVAQSLISTLENGTRDNPTQDTMNKLAAAFGMSPAQFLAEVQDSTPPDAEHPPEDLFRAVFDQKLADDILALWQDLTLKQRLELIEMAKDLERRRRDATDRATTVLQSPAPMRLAGAKH